MNQKAIYSSVSSDVYQKGIDEYDEDCAFSNQSDYYSTVGLSSSLVMSSASVSMDGIDLSLDSSNKTNQPLSQDGTFLALAGNQQPDANILSHPHDYNLYTYPSGRPPLVPLDWDKKSNGRKLPEVDKTKSQNRQGDREGEGEDMSWIERTLCIVHTPFNAVDHSDDQNNATCAPNDGYDSSTYTKVNDLCRNSSREDDDDAYFSSNSSYEAEDMTEEAEQSQDPITRGSTMVHGDGQKVQPSLLQEQVSDKIQLNLEVLASLNNFFKESSVLCNDWSSSWYNEMEQKSEVIQTKPNFHQNRDVPHNSTSNLAARKKRVEYLRRNLTPFESDWIELNQGAINVRKYSPVECDGVKFSFSNAFVASSNMEKPGVDRPQMKSFQRDDCVNECSPLIDTSCGIGGTKDIEIVPSEEELSLDDDYFCYDSDPSDLMHLDRSPKNTRTSKAKRSRKRSKVNVDAIDEATCLQKISEHMNAKRLLVWHRGSTEGATDPPVAVLSWIEHGSQLDSGLIQPKFCWRRSYSKEPHSKSVLKFSRYHGIDLLDISRIVAADNYIERIFYPFVKRRNSFVIEAFEEELIFEARDEAERDDIVEGLKLLVARLGSKIIMGDGRVLDEFFSPMGASVPGRIPSVFSVES